jgi:predicted nucleic acid-binding protein
VSYLVDTNVLCEPTQKHPEVKVLQWLQEHAGDYYVSSLTIGEVVCGIERLDQGRKRRSLEAWLKITLDRLEGRVLAFNTRIAIEWGRLVAQLEPRGVQL